MNVFSGVDIESEISLYPRLLVYIDTKTKTNDPKLIQWLKEWLKSNKDHGCIK